MVSAAQGRDAKAAPPGCSGEPDLRRLSRTQRGGAVRDRGNDRVGRVQHVGRGLSRPEPRPPLGEPGALHRTHRAGHVRSGADTDGGLLLPRFERRRAHGDRRQLFRRYRGTGLGRRGPAMALVGAAGGIRGRHGSLPPGRRPNRNLLRRSVTGACSIAIPSGKSGTLFAPLLRALHSRRGSPVMASPESTPDVSSTTSPSGLVQEDRLRLVKLGILTLVCLALCVWLAIPLLPALTWGMALAIIAWPLHVWMSRRIHWRAAAAALTSAVVVLVILAAGFFVTYELAREAASQADQMKERAAGDVLREAMSNAPGLRGVVEWADRVQIDLDRALRQFINSYTQDASALVQGSIRGVIQFAVAVFFLFHFLRDRPAILAGVRTLLPLTRVESDRVFKSVTDSVHANLYATVITSIIDGIGGGLMFWLLGLPSPVLWGVVMFILSVLPILGTFLVWAPAAAYLALIGNWPAALALVAWGVSSWFIVDNFIYVRLAGDRMRMHQVPALLVFLGGLAVFGVSGMIIGPAIAAVTMAVLDLWRQSSKDAPIGPGVDPTGEAVVGTVAEDSESGVPRAGQVVEV